MRQYQEVALCLSADPVHHMLVLFDRGFRGTSVLLSEGTERVVDLRIVQVENFLDEALGSQRCGLVCGTTLAAITKRSTHTIYSSTPRSLLQVTDSGRDQNH